jgi:hypothetical protein
VVEWKGVQQYNVGSFAKDFIENLDIVGPDFHVEAISIMQLSAVSFSF